MRNAAAPIDRAALRSAVQARGRKEGAYNGGLCDIVGTGGDSHNTFNISTTASILASSLLMIAKHGNRASTSKSGSADLLLSTPRPPSLNAISPSNLPSLYRHTNYAFLFAPTFHPGMRFVAPIRKELGWRTIFNLLGPLSNPVDDKRPVLEARVIGVARRDLGPAFARAFVLSGVRKAMVVCGDEELDELSCAGPTHCWRIVERANPAYTSTGDADHDSDTSDDDAEPPTLAHVEYFTLSPSDFGFPPHPLASVGPGKEPKENAAIFTRILAGEMDFNDPIMHFVLINTAALFVVSGICEGDSSCMGEGDDGQVITERGPGGGRWKEGVRRAKWAISSGAAGREWERFVEGTKGL
ncbi:anthranilate phosphoribosyltransferase [Trichodelitschia bisporula]|uniref:Anthranilate phosphoribosyltransferase n=1 Tax=Trichodelitschia bisporula TaxID=703511 RepID=A0A6G1HZG8_9PEZI|nr:anthranilate phosphoribosyltransferase [Trichodelitschia bisporula]